MHIDVNLHINGTLGQYKKLQTQPISNMGLTYAGANSTQHIQVKNKAKEVYFAVVYLLGLGREQYRKLLEDLLNKHVKGIKNIQRL